MQSQQISHSDIPINLKQTISDVFTYNGFKVDCNSGKAEKTIDGYKLTINFGSKNGTHESLKKQIDKYNEESIQHIIKSIDESGVLAKKESGNNSIYKFILTCDGNGFPDNLQAKYKDNKNKAKIKTIEDYEKKILTLDAASGNKGTEEIHNHLEKINGMKKIVDLMTAIEAASKGLYKVGENASAEIPAAEPQASDPKQSQWENYLHKAVTNLSTASCISSSLGIIFKKTTNLTGLILEPLLNNRTWIELTDVFEDINKGTVILLWNVPLKLYKFGKSIKDLYGVKDAEDKNKLYDAGLLATAAFGTIIEIPGKIAGAIEMFKPITHVGLWGNILGAVAAVFSIAEIISSTRNYSSSRDQLRELESESLMAYLNQLKILVETGKIDENALKCFGENKNKILMIIEEQLQGLADIKNHSEADKYLTDIQKKLDEIPPSSLKTQLLAAGDAAFIECVLKKQVTESHFLEKHFQVDGEKLDSRLKEINGIYKRKVRDETNSSNPMDHANSAEYIRNAASNLKARVTDTITSEELNIITNSVGLVASVIFTVIGFGAATALGPIGYAIVIGLAIFALAKIYNDWKRRKEFKSAMSLVD